MSKKACPDYENESKHHFWTGSGFPGPAPGTPGPILGTPGLVAGIRGWFRVPRDWPRDFRDRLIPKSPGLAPGPRDRRPRDPTTSPQNSFSFDRPPKV